MSADASALDVRVRKLGYRALLEEGSVVTSGDTVEYVVSNVAHSSMTLKRLVPKVRGKAARKALKRARRRP